MEGWGNWSKDTVSHQVWGLEYRSPESHKDRCSRAPLIPACLQHNGKKRWVNPEAHGQLAVANSKRVEVVLWPPHDACLFLSYSNVEMCIYTTQRHPTPTIFFWEKMAFRIWEKQDSLIRSILCISWECWHMCYMDIILPK